LDVGFFNSGWLLSSDRNFSGGSEAAINTEWLNPAYCVEKLQIRDSAILLRRERRRV